MLMFTKTSTEATITSTDNIHMDQALHMAGQTALALQAQLDEESAELAINATSFGRNVMDKHHVLIVLASFRHQVLLLQTMLIVYRIWLRLRIH